MTTMVPFRSSRSLLLLLGGFLGGLLLLGARPREHALHGVVASLLTGRLLPQVTVHQLFDELHAPAFV